MIRSAYTESRRVPICTSLVWLVLSHITLHSASVWHIVSSVDDLLFSFFFYVMSSASAALLMNGGTYAPYGTITADNHGSYIIIVTWTFACISVLFVAVRVILRTWMSKHVGWDDGLIVAALVRFDEAFTIRWPALIHRSQLFAIGQSTAASKSVQYGLGRHVDSLDNEQIRSYYRVSAPPIHSQAARH